jgi:GNAT superfamily N-acetyltransferase
MLKIQIVQDKNLSKPQMDLMNKWRKKEFGKGNVKNYKKDYWPGAKFFFLKDGKEIVAFGALRDISVQYLGKDYKILGICNIIAIQKGKGYGKALIQNMIKFAKKKSKTALGFCANEKAKFYEKAGLKVKKHFTWRFALKNPKTGRLKFDSGDCIGIYIEGKDRLIKKIISTKAVCTYYLPDIKGPHW